MNVSNQTSQTFGLNFRIWNKKTSFGVYNLVKWRISHEKCLQGKCMQIFILPFVTILFAVELFDIAILFAKFSLFHQMKNIFPSNTWGWQVAMIFPLDDSNLNTMKSLSSFLFQSHFVFYNREFFNRHFLFLNCHKIIICSGFTYNFLE